MLPVDRSCVQLSSLAVALSSRPSERSTGSALGCGGLVSRPQRGVTSVQRVPNAWRLQGAALHAYGENAPRWRLIVLLNRYSRVHLEAQCAWLHPVAFHLRRLLRHVVDGLVPFTLFKVDYFGLLQSADCMNEGWECQSFRPNYRVICDYGSQHIDLAQDPPCGGQCCLECRSCAPSAAWPWHVYNCL